MRTPVPPLPADSAIRLQQEPDELRLHWDVGAIPWYARLLIGGFVLVWLAGWAAGEWSALSQLLRAANRGGWWGPGEFFLLFWLAGWSLGGLVACFMLFLVLTPSTPERLTLREDSLWFKRGYGISVVKPAESDDDQDDDDEPPPASADGKAMGQRGGGRDVPRRVVGAQPTDVAAWRNSYRPREFSRVESPPFELDRPTGVWRLYFDVGVERVEIGASLADPDRFWLYELLEEWRTRRPLDYRPWLDDEDDSDDRDDSDETDDEDDDEDEPRPEASDEPRRDPFDRPRRP